MPLLSIEKKNWWMHVGEVDEVKWKKDFLQWEVTVSDKAAITETGMVFSFEYGTPNMDICFAENYIHAFVPYCKLKGLLKTI